VVWKHVEVLNWAHRSLTNPVATGLGQILLLLCLCLSLDHLGPGRGEARNRVEQRVPE